MFALFYSYRLDSLKPTRELRLIFFKKSQYKIYRGNAYYPVARVDADPVTATKKRGGESEKRFA